MSTLTLNLDDLTEIRNIQAFAERKLAEYERRMKEAGQSAPVTTEQLADLFVDIFERYGTTSNIASELEERYNALLKHLEDRHERFRSLYNRELTTFRSLRGDYESTVFAAKDAYYKLNGVEHNMAVDANIASYNPDEKRTNVQAQGNNRWRKEAQ